MRPSSCVRTFVVCSISLAVIGCAHQGDTTSSHPNAASSTTIAALTIRETDSPTNGDSREPELNATHDGRIVLSWVEKTGEKRYALRTAIRDSKEWSESNTVAEGENWFVNWADFPSAIVLRDGSLAAHWLVKSGKSTYAYNVHISRSNDGGKTWSAPIVPHRDNTQTEHGFVHADNWQINGCPVNGPSVAADGRRVVVAWFLLSMTNRT